MSDVWNNTPLPSPTRDFNQYRKDHMLSILKEILCLRSREVPSCIIYFYSIGEEMSNPTMNHLPRSIHSHPKNVLIACSKFNSDSLHWSQWPFNGNHSYAHISFFLFLPFHASIRLIRDKCNNKRNVVVAAVTSHPLNH